MKAMNQRTNFLGYRITTFYGKQKAATASAIERPAFSLHQADVRESQCHSKSGTMNVATDGRSLLLL
jgi:hypothetical protein